MMINYDVKFITCDESIHLKNCDDKSFKYETKKRSDESVYDVGKKNYHERRGGQWRAPRPRQLKQLESKLRDKTVIKSVWTSESLITLVFSSGAIAYLTVKIDSLDITQILFDRYFVGKLSGQIVTNVALCKSHLLFAHNDRTATLVTFSKNNNSCTPCRIPERDPTLHSIELGGGSRRTERHITSADTPSGCRILVWSVSAAEPAPWSPIIEDLANLHLYQINGHNISLLACHQLENDTLLAELSHTDENAINIVEQITCQKNGVSIEWTVYDAPDAGAGKLSAREEATVCGVGAAARCVRRSPCDSRLLVACIDGALHVIHRHAGLTHSTKAAFIASDVRWAGELLLASEEGGRLQCFDRALQLLHQHTRCLDLTTYLREPRRMKVLESRGCGGGSVALAFAGGPLALVRVSHPRLLTAWISGRRLSSAVSLLRAMDWDAEGTRCLWALNRIVCAALRSPPECVSAEGAAQAALGSFLAPAAELGARALRYAPPVYDLARKFFHHLLRRGRFEKALSLAVELRAWDLCSDARAAARAQGRAALADEADHLARYYAAQHSDSECSESCSECGSRSYTSEADTTASSEIGRSRPPPLPRVSLPPALLPVAVSQPEPVSTGSIRPNLHQYLDRDETIWTTDTLKPILNAKWHDGLHRKANRNESEPAPPHYKHLFQTEPLYRYRDTGYRAEDKSHANDGSDKQRSEKNKVKFSDTVTIAVVSDEAARCEEGRETAGRRYRPAMAPPLHNTLENNRKKTPKIKVIQLGMV